MPQLSAILALSAALAGAFAMAAPPAAARTDPPPIPGVDRNAWLVPFPKAPADTFTRRGMWTGSHVSREDCGKADGRNVYVAAMGRGACIRYFVSGEAFPARVAAVYLSGDKGNFRIVWRDGRYEIIPSEILPGADGKPSGRKANLDARVSDPARLEKIARTLAGRIGAPAIVLARQGMDGSAGWVALRRTRWEVEITDRALDAIKARHGLVRLHLVGQSGGGHLVGALSILRSDVACAVAGAAPLAMNPSSFYLSDKLPAQQRFFNPAARAGELAGRKGLRLMLVTDGRDGRVFVESQARFVREAARKGVKIPQHFVTAGDALSHGVTAYSLAALRACLAGRSDDEIGAQLARMNADALEKRLAGRKAAGASEGAEEGEERRGGRGAPDQP